MSVEPDTGPVGVGGGEAERYGDPLTVRLDQVRVRFRRQEHAALTVPELSLRRGDHLLVLGTSGSGKSTLLNALTGVVPHTVTAEVSGEVVICGKPTDESSVVELSRHLGVLAQDPSAGVCLPHVEQELALPLENQAVRPEEISDRIDEALETVAAGGLRSRPSSELSGGEAQRVALAASLAARPDLLLLDEPTSMLDAAGVASVRHALAEASRRYDPTVVLVEHRLDDVVGTGGVAALPEVALVLGPGGEAVAFGPTVEVLERHARELHAAGCWLPLETELYTLTGVRGGLRAPVNHELLLSVSQDDADDADGAGDAGDTGHSDPAGREGPTPSPAGDVVLSARDLAVSRDAKAPPRRWRRPAADEAAPILRDVTFNLHAGETVALLGANGSGKSTLLLTLAGLLLPAAGSVQGPRPGLVFQNPEHQFVSHTVAGEIGHGLGADRAALVARQLRRHRLEGLADLSPFRLSGGEKRRLSMAAMLAHDRPALLLDEPTLGLDRRDTIATMEALRVVAHEGRSVLFASHDLRTVATLADRVVVLAEGHIVAEGPVFDVLSDVVVLQRAGLELPPLVDWLMRNAGSAAAVRRALRALDRPVIPPVPAPPPVAQVPSAVVHR